MAKRPFSVVVLVVTMAGLTLVGTPTWAAAEEEARLLLSGSGSGVVTKECHGYRAVNKVSVRGRSPDGDVVKGRVRSDSTYLGCGQPNTFTLRMEGGTVAGHFESFYVDTTAAGGYVRAVVSVDRATGSYSTYLGRYLHVAYNLVYPPMPNEFPAGPTKLAGYTIVSVVSGGGAPPAG